MDVDGKNSLNDGYYLIDLVDGCQLMVGFVDGCSAQLMQGLQLQLATALLILGVPDGVDGIVEKMVYQNNRLLNAGTWMIPLSKWLVTMK